MSRSPKPLTDLQGETGSVLSAAPAVEGEEVGGGAGEISFGGALHGLLRLREVGKVSRWSRC